MPLTGTKTTIQQRQANRRNALRSTGPKSPAGKRRSSRNARRHGLSDAGEAITLDPLLSHLSLLIEQDRIDPFMVQEIASKILSYERNQAYQRELFLQSQESSRSKAAVHQSMRNAFGPELDMMADVLDEQEHQPEQRHQGSHEGPKGRVNKSDLNVLLKIQRQMLSLVVKQAQQRDEEQAERLRQSVRYLKRSSNQLIKSLKRLGPP